MVNTSFLCIRNEVVTKYIHLYIDLSCIWSHFQYWYILQSIQWQNPYSFLKTELEGTIGVWSVKLLPTFKELTPIKRVPCRRKLFTLQMSNGASLPRRTTPMHCSTAFMKDNLIHQWQRRMKMSGCFFEK